ncbi:Methicillin resistance mecR1 protein [Gimesia panareensis]|uniref:Methicillin resistance mecR1 protein n=1 Tax=Gimesia panareensis TaxID=2527978 RepID=A0A517QDC3_9PLAN|nr:M56 family metallopeptidase [Gimesia panareensis]QDT29628.1 Methicillin resistance mecR1 protein [Gimesia panareensis]
MMTTDLLLDILLRLSLLLATGWLVLFFLSARNPRWSVLLARFLSVACLLFPLICLTLPPLAVAILPPSEVSTTTPNVKPVPAKASQATPDIAPMPEIDLNSPVATRDSAAPGHSIKNPSESEPEIAAAPVSAQPETALSAPKPAEIEAVSSPATVSPQPAASVPSISLTEWLWIAWSTGTVILLFRLAWQLQRAARLRTRSESASETVQQQCESLVDRAQLKQSPQVRFSSDIEGACTAGVFYPIIYLPRDWYESLPEAEQRAILLHELSHVAGRDVFWNLITQLAVALYWFHPLVWRLPARHRLACEHLSDAQAANAFDSLSDYRRLLAQWTLRRQGAEARLTALAMADRSQMLRRLKWLEKPSIVDRLHISRSYAFVLFALISAVSLATVQFSPQVIAQKADPPEKEKQSEANDDSEKPKAEQKQPAAPKVRKPGKPDINLKQTTPKIVTVVNEKDKPIAGAKVRVGWWEDNEGDMLGKITINPPVTNKKGEVTIQVPDGAARAQISAEAEGYATAGTQYSLSGNPKLILKPGRIIRVKAVDAKGNRLPDAYPLLEDSHILGREFKQDKQRLGYFTSPVVELDRRWMRVVDDNGEGPVLFSHLIDVTNPERVEDDGTILAILEPGIRLEGRLDDPVPRPIKHGCVELYINEGQDHKIGGGWTWQQTATVKEDGTFEFDSLPTGGQVQLFALVDGYQSTRPTVQALKDYLKAHDAGPESILENAIRRHDAFWPHLFPLTPGLYKTEVELPCTPTTSLDVKVVDPIGQPIEGAEVKFNPNGLFLGGELFIPATESLTIENRIDHPDKDEIKQRYQWAQDTFLRVKSDKQGIARVRNLPADDRESYKVSADGYQMPIYPNSFEDGPRQYALIDLAGGKTLRRTITMEKYVPVSSREILVVDRQAEPVPGITVTVSEIAFANAPEDWQLWASQRFGPVATEKSGDDGIVRLTLPLEVNGEAVSRLRITVKGRMNVESTLRDAYVQRKRLIIPRQADGRVVVLTISKEEPREKYQFFDVAVTYEKPEALLSNLPKILLQKLQKQPSMVVLNALLKMNKFDDATPLQFTSDWNLTGKNSSRKSERSSIATIATEQGERTIILCAVRPKGATWELKPELRFPPRAAFIFDAEGSLIRMLGGWASSSGSYSNLMLVNMGGTDDYFYETSAFEPHGPFKYIQRWYQVGREAQPALTIHNYANSTSWNGKPGPSQPLAEFGFLGFHFNGRNLDFKVCGVLPNGTLAPRKVYWDSARQQFIGPVEESVEGEPLYQVIPGESHQFTPLKVEPGELIVAGGRRDYENWHAWSCVVPEGKTARVRLFAVDESGNKPVETEYFARDLSAGQHNLQLQYSNDQQDKTESAAELRIDDSVKEKLTVPRILIADGPSVKGVPIARTGKEALDLFNRETADQRQRLVWRVELKPD